MLNTGNQGWYRRGDTLVEVLFATAVFSFVAIGALLIMNQGSSTAQRALEITLVRQEIDAQAEALRFLNTSYISAYQSGGSYSNYAATWQDIDTNYTVASATTFGGNISSCPTTLPAKSFILNARQATMGPAVQPTAQTFSQVDYNAPISASGIWIEAVRVPAIGASVGNYQDNAAYIDFHIRACWDSPGQAVPVTLGTIVRLYEPKG